MHVSHRTLEHRAIAVSADKVARRGSVSWQREYKRIAEGGTEPLTFQPFEGLAEALNASSHR